MIVKIKKFNDTLARLHKKAERYEIAAGGIVTILGGIVLVLSVLVPEDEKTEAAPLPE